MFGRLMSDVFLFLGSLRFTSLSFINIISHREFSSIKLYHTIENNRLERPKTTMDSLPRGFGEETAADAPGDVYAKYQRLTQAKASSNKSDSDSDDSDDSEELPITHSFSLEPHTKSIHSMAFSPSGHRLYTASADYNLNVYDFNQMNPVSRYPSKSLEIYETHSIQKLDINNHNQILALPHDLSFQVLDSNCEKIHEFREGDRYIYDVKQTRGHTDTIRDGVWNPQDSTKLITCSNDSTFRIWDLPKTKQETVNFIKNKGKKIKISHVRYTPDSQTIIAIDESSRLTTWDPKTFQRPTTELPLPAKPTSIAMNPKDPNSFTLQSMDNSIRLYDLRNLSTPMIQRPGFPTTKYSPGLVYNGQYILAATSYDVPGEQNIVHILDRSDMCTVSSIQYDENVMTLDWNDRINQISVGLVSGKLDVLFNPDISKDGAMGAIQNKPKKRRNFDESEGVVTSSASQTGYNMNELAELNRSKKTKKDDEGKKQKFIWGTTDADKIENNINLEDPREALKKFVESKK